MLPIASEPADTDRLAYSSTVDLIRAPPCRPRAHPPAQQLSYDETDETVRRPACGPTVSNSPSLMTTTTALFRAPPPASSCLLTDKNTGAKKKWPSSRLEIRCFCGLVRGNFACSWGFSGGAGRNRTLPVGPCVSAALGRLTSIISSQWKDPQPQDASRHSRPPKPPSEASRSCRLVDDELGWSLGKKNLSWNGGLRQPVTTNDRSVGDPRRRVGGDVDGVEHTHSHSPVLKGAVCC